MPRQLREGLESVLGGLNPDEMAGIAGRLIADASAGPTGRDQPPSARSKAGDQVLDLAVIVHPRDLKAATIRSLLAESLAASDAEQLAALDEPLEKLRRAHPDDLSVAIAATLRRIASGESSQAGPALERLDRLVEKTPLEPLPPGGRANARQRAEAARQVPLWLVASACNRRPDAATDRAIAERLSARALEAARRQADNLTLLAMVREQGEIAMARGDRKGAEASWGRLLDLIMPAPPAQTRRAQPGRGQLGPGRPAAPTPAPKRTAARKVL